MNYCILFLAFIPIIFSNATVITNNDDQIVPSLLSIKEFVLTLNFDNAVTDDRRLQCILEIYADNVPYNLTLGSMILNGSSTFTFLHYEEEDITIINQFHSITINTLFIFQYYEADSTIIKQPLITLVASTYTDNWVSTTQNGENISPHILWNTTFQYRKSCQNQNFGFFCDNQTSATSTSTTTTTASTSSPFTYSSISSTISTISDCFDLETKINDLEKQRNDEKDKKNLFFWLMIGFIVFSIILLILTALFCCCWLRDRGRVAQYAENPQKPKRDRRDRVDIVHPHSYPEEPRVEQNVTIRQRTLPPYRPPQQQQHPKPQQQKSNQGPIDASSNVALPRTQHSQQPSRPFQYPSGDDDWSVPPNEHVV